MTSAVTDEQGLDGNEGGGAVGLVIDADGHCNEPWRELGAWMPPEFADKGPIDYGGRVVWEDHVLLRARRATTQAPEVRSRTRSTLQAGRGKRTRCSGCETWTTKGSTSP